MTRKRIGEASSQGIGTAAPFLISLTSTRQFLNSRPPILIDSAGAVYLLCALASGAVCFGDGLQPAVLGGGAAHPKAVFDGVHQRRDLCSLKTTSRLHSRISFVYPMRGGKGISAVVTGDTRWQEPVPLSRRFSKRARSGRGARLRHRGHKAARYFFSSSIRRFRGKVYIHVP
jgi:hypothetical protein